MDRQEVLAQEIVKAINEINFNSFSEEEVAEGFAEVLYALEHKDHVFLDDIAEELEASGYTELVEEIKAHLWA